MSTLAESMKAVNVNGVVSLTGVLGDSEDEMPSIMDCLWQVCSVRGVILGTRNQFKDMIKFIEEKAIEPVIDERVFGIHEVAEAYRWLEEQKHFSKVVISIE
jgi:D-arabinose 1-dehydrogenase-like Zn-dependent alcohol dehydrogenase